jgi:hypothetical protein
MQGSRLHVQPRIFKARHTVVGEERTDVLLLALAFLRHSQPVARLHVVAPTQPSIEHTRLDAHERPVLVSRYHHGRWGHGWGDTFARGWAHLAEEQAVWQVPLVP